jgi:outer membrane receptor for ferric coprogen and ferric-rhodotorulic acid
MLLKGNLVSSSGIRNKQAKGYSAEIEENILYSKIEPYQYPRIKTEAKTKMTKNSTPDPITLLAEKLNQMNAQFIQTLNRVMNRLTSLEKNQSAQRPSFLKQQRDATGWKTKHQQEAKALNTLNPVGMVNLEESPRCSPCQEPHLEDECPR